MVCLRQQRLGQMAAGETGHSGHQDTHGNLRMTGGRQCLYQALLTTEQYQVRIDHHADQFLEVNARPPAQLVPCLGGVADQQIHLGRTDQAGSCTTYLRQSRSTWPNAVSTNSRTYASRRWRRRNRPACPAAASATWPGHNRRRSPSRASHQIAQPQFLRQPELDAGRRHRVTLRVTNSMPRRGDS